MKKSIIFAALALITAVGYSQAYKGPTADVKTAHAGKLPAKDTAKPAVKPESPEPAIVAPKQYVILLSETEIKELYAFITNADNYSDKGRQLVLAALDKHVVILPPTPPADSVTKKK